jgi:CO/xanthine dehydrogenase Mo-binding subunit
VVADELGVAPERIEIEVWDTDVVAYDSGIGGSRGSRVATTVAHEVVRELKQALLAHVGQTLEWPVEDLDLKGDEVWRRGLESCRWADVLARDRKEIAVEAHVEERGYAPITSFVAQVAEVAVDPETGAVTLLNFTTAIDAGRVLNPVGHQGQINGGFMQGLGFALMEELRIEDGQVMTLSFGDNKFPTIRDIPPHRTVVLEANVGGVGPYQIKGIGESAIVPVAAAVANAVYDASGVRIYDLPITAEKVLRALQAKRNARD